MFKINWLTLKIRPGCLLFFCSVLFLATHMEDLGEEMGGLTETSDRAKEEVVEEGEVVEDPKETGAEVV